MTISIVLYGRNDNYGYNLHKRAALSLNCMATVLTDPSDEIVFVDYNTPDDFPTFPEAIQDTLTKRARDLLRILRVRPRVHERFRGRTHLLALEPVARNVGVRRSCAANRWILSTNTDMIFVPHGAMSLSDLARDLPPGFYHAPRMEIPELLWESFDRKAPETTITTIREWGRTLHLNEIILGAKFILYDGPGDFQLLRRDDLFAHQGFHEGMLLGWHVDSNIAKRMYLKYGTVGDLGNQLYGYHCDHTRQLTAAHSRLQLQNDWRVFCDQVDTPSVAEQAETWGCARETIEEVRLAVDPARVYVQALQESIGNPLDETRTIKFTHETFNKIDYDPGHIVPFLADMLATMPKESNLAWCGARTETLSRFSIVWDRLGFTGKILEDSELIGLKESNGAIQAAPTATLLSADVFVFDFGGLPGPAEKRQHNTEISRQLLRRFMQVVQEERRRFSSGLSPRRILALNAINNHFEWLVRGYLAAAVTPCATHMRHGFVLPAETRENWLPLLYTGQAGIRSAHHVIQSDTRHLGTVAYGPYKYLMPGHYRASLKIEVASEELKPNGNNELCVGIEVRIGAEVLGVRLIDRAALVNPDHELIFKVTSRAAEMIEGVEARIWLFNRVALTLRSLTIEPVPTTAEADAAVSIISPPIALQIRNWLPYLSLGPLGRADASSIVAQRGPADFVVFGPYWPLPANHYEAIISIEGLEPQQESPSNVVIRADVISREQQLAAVVLSDRDTALPMIVHLPFQLDGDSPEQRQIEARVWSSGDDRFRIRSLEVKPLGQPSLRDLLPFLVLGKVGRRVGAEVTNVSAMIGTVAYSPTLRVRIGSYRLIFGIGVKVADEISEEMQGCAIAQVTYGSELLAACEIGPDDSSEDHRLEFDVPASLDPAIGLQFLLRTLAPVEIALRALSLEPVEANFTPTGAAPINLRNWLPFLQTGAGAQTHGSSIVVHAGIEGFAVYGPYWMLPAGRYELRASVISHPQDIHEGAVVTCQVAADSGTHVVAENKWRLNQYRTAGGVLEFRMPFRLGDDVGRARRTIETRIFTPGNARFRVHSLSIVECVTLENDWFAYSVVEDCGIHTGTGIKSLPDKIGYVACTPAMALAPGHYRLLPDLSLESNPSDTLIFEVWSGPDLIALERINSADQAAEFDVADEHIGQAVQLRVRLLAPAQLLIRHLRVEKVSSTITASWRDRLARIQQQSCPKPTEVSTQTEVAPLSNLVRLLAACAMRIKRRRD